MSVIDELVTDRTQADLDRVRELKKKIMQGGGIYALSDSERAEYFANPQKGAYNYTDLNRVGNATLYVKNFYKMIEGDIDVNPKTNWKVEDIPTAEQMNTYLNDIKKIKSTAKSTLELPLSMDKLNYEGANQIERVLVEAYRKAEEKIRDFIYSGETDSGFW